jgi:outer membrane protein OmpA-like peptidoglycan-associated protein
MRNRLVLSFLIILILTAKVWAMTPCDEASQRVNETKSLDNLIHRQLQKELLEQALTLCPNHSEAHSRLGAVLEREKDYANAIYHYQQALVKHPNDSKAWLGIGQVYLKQGQRPLELEATLNACMHSQAARQRVTELLRDHLYRIADGDVVLNHNSLSLLYDRQRLQNLYQMATRCYRLHPSIAANSMTLKAMLQPVVIFRQSDYSVSKDDLTLISKAQLEEIATTLHRLDAQRIIIRGYSANQPVNGNTLAESQPLNWQLSRNRAKFVADALADYGFPRNRIRYYGYGTRRPLVKGNNEAAWAKNRRVEIEVGK